ncbi:Uncharacterised protein [uncultured archaeon]|nr:Uncharacterised protein [uncultured archaeon]
MANWLWNAAKDVRRILKECWNAPTVVILQPRKEGENLQEN